MGDRLTNPGDFTNIDALKSIPEFYRLLMIVVVGEIVKRKFPDSEQRSSERTLNALRTGIVKKSTDPRDTDPKALRDELETFKTLEDLKAFCEDDPRAKKLELQYPKDEEIPRLEEEAVQLWREYLSLDVPDEEEQIN